MRLGSAHRILLPLTVRSDVSESLIIPRFLSYIRDREVGVPHGLYIGTSGGIWLYEYICMDIENCLVFMYCDKFWQFMFIL